MAALCSTAAILAVSCEKKEINPQAPEDPQDPSLVEVTLSATVEDSKVLSDGVTMKWNSSADNLSVFAETGGNVALYKFSKAAGSSAVSANFSGSVPQNATLKYAVYPYSLDRTCENNVLGLMLNRRQSCDAVNSVPHNIPLYGIVSGASVTMTNPCAFLKVMLPKKSDESTLAIYDSLRVSASQCAGNFTVNLTTPANPVVSKGDLDELALAPRKSHSGYVFVPILPGTYDDITISVEYNDGHAAFSRQSTTSQTFESGYFYDCHEFAGPYVESVTTGTGAVEGTTLSMAGSAVLWKYAGVSNSDYTCKFFYAAHGTPKDASGWTEVAASSVTGEGTDVSFSASATVEAGDYDFYAQVVAAGVPSDGSVVAVAAKEIINVEFVFAAEMLADPYSFVYNTLSQGSSDGMKMITDSDGNPVIPTFKPSSTTSYYYKAWNATDGAFGAVTASTAIPTGNQLGMTISKGIFSIKFPDFSSNGTSAAYWCVNSNLLCITNNKFFAVNCPAGYTITAITLKCAANKTCNWGIGTASGTMDIMAKTDIKDASNPVVVKVDIPAAVQAKAKKYYVASGANNDRLSSIVVTYEQ